MALAWIRMVLGVYEMPRVPHNDVLTVHRFTTDESRDLRLCLRGGTGPPTMETPSSISWPLYRRTHISATPWLSAVPSIALGRI